jgi:hypothetical protein
MRRSIRDVIHTSRRKEGALFFGVDDSPFLRCNKFGYGGTTMAKRVFISFAKEDEKYRDFLVGQAKNEKCPV